MRNHAQHSTPTTHSSAHFKFFASEPLQHGASNVLCLFALRGGH